MTDEYGDTSVDSSEDSQTSEYEGENVAVAGDTGEFEPEYDDKGNPQPIPYERFKESRSQLREARETGEQMQSQMNELQENLRRQQEYSQYAYQEMQRLQQKPQVAPEEDVYEDPLEQKINQLEQQQKAMHEQLAHRQSELSVQQAERELTSEISAAQRRYPSMRKLDVVNAVIQNPRANISALAKRSHESVERGYHDRLRRDGYAPKARTLTRGQGPMPVAKDFGDDLEGAEAAAIEFLNNS
jgi:chromosome segregation ATPase